MAQTDDSKSVTAGVIAKVEDVIPFDSSRICLYNAFEALPMTKNNELSILSLNTLYKKWATADEYPQLLKNPNWSDWESHRLPRLRNMISSYKSDIICLQEIDKHDFKSDFGCYFESDSYSYIINTSKKNKIAMANAILYKNNKFDCILVENRSRCMIALFQIKHHLSLCQNCVRTPYCKCKSKTNSNGKSESKCESECECDAKTILCNDGSDLKYPLCTCNCVVVVNVHLEGSPEKAATRYNQMKSTLTRIEFEIDRLIKKYNLQGTTWNTNKFNKINVIICGDFNSGVSEEIEKLLLTQQMEPSFRIKSMQNMIINDSNKTYKHKWSLYEAYRHLNNDYFKNNNKLKRHLLFPTFAAYDIVGSVDFFYYNQNCMQCLGVARTLPAHKAFESLKLKMLESKSKSKSNCNINKNDNENEMENEMKSNEKIEKLKRLLGSEWFVEMGNESNGAWLQLPDYELVSDHLPIAAVFKLKQCKDFINLNGNELKHDLDTMPFRCCIELEPKKQKKKGKNNKNKNKNKQVESETKIKCKDNKKEEQMNMKMKMKSDCLNVSMNEMNVNSQFGAFHEFCTL